MDSGEYIRELDIRLKERDRSFKIRQAEIEKEVDKRYERIREEVRKENEEQKKKLSYKILSTTFKVFVFLLVTGFAIVAGMYYLIVALIISWIVGGIFIKIL